MKHRVLVVVDMQHDFVDGVLGTPEARAIVPKIQKLINGMDKENDLIIFTYDTHTDYYLDTSEGRHLPVPHCIDGTRGWQNVFEEAEERRKLEDARLDTCRSNIVIERKFTFGDIFLDDTIEEVKFFDWHDRDEDVQIELCGVCTDICVISNALILKAQYPEIPIYVYPDACAGVTPELHEAALKVMKSCQIDFLEVE